MKTCKYCKKPILTSISGIRDFCSKSCKNEYRKSYLKQKKQQNKAGNKNNGHVDTYPKCYHDSKGITTHEKGKNDPKNAMSETLSDEELKIAKSCCNYEMKQKVGYCITLYEPYYPFRIPCRNCKLFQALKQHIEKIRERKKLSIANA